MNIKFLDVLFAPVDDKVLGTGGGVESIIDLLNDESDEKKEDLLADDEKEEKDDKETRPKEKEPKGKDKDDEEELEEKEEDEEEIELEEEEEEKEPDDLELVTPVPRKEILKKYPNIFKEFPYLEKAMYREQQYTELLPTIEDAKEIVERVKDFDKFESEVLSGSIESTLKAVKDTDAKAFTRIADNYLPNLMKVDEKAYYHVIGNVIKSTIIGMAQEARRSNNENLLGAAQILNQFIYGSSEFQPPTKLNPESEQPDSEKEALKNERAQYLQERFESSKDELTTKVSNILKSAVSQHIDPKGIMTDYVKRTAVREAMENLENLISQDTRFRSLLDKFWEKSFSDNLSQKSLNEIKKAYLSKAKTLLPTVIQKSRNDALKGLGKRVREEKEEKEETRPRTSLRSPREREDNDKPRNKGNPSAGMRTIDYLMQD